VIRERVAQKDRLQKAPFASSYGAISERAALKDRPKNALFASSLRERVAQKTGFRKRRLRPAQTALVAAEVCPSKTNVAICDVFWNRTEQARRLAEVSPAHAARCTFVHSPVLPLTPLTPAGP